ncbi:MAG: hypothetical protein HY544_01730 [Candidatus Diapherotrites archaeon]|uniref:dolichyl-phosphooligosaccharide-protein glycotransferase n=1 Tax=Candidatus Iainarchaeum sp. TaxID=3101447 RepID=A0A8T3YKR2_9ARCH|nr:hypothetical protein [Candidatus Diapherotrites archaeon]
MMLGQVRGQALKARAYVLAHRKEILFVFLIFLLGFGVRGQLMSYDLMFEFDSYFHARIVEYVATHNFQVPSSDPLAYYELASSGGAPMPSVGTFFWLLSALLFKLITLNAPFSKAAFINVVKFLPAFFGALISVGMYFLGRELYGKKAGITMGVFAAIMPAFAYRTMAGWLEDDSFGFLPMVFGLYFMVKAVKKAEFSRQTLTDAVIAAVLFSIMGWSWGGFLVVPLILVGWFIGTVALMWLRNDTSERILNISKSFAVIFILMSALVTFGIGTGWISGTTGYITKYLPFSSANVQNIAGGGQDTTSVYSVSVGEESKGFPNWGYKYNALIVFPFVALLLLAWRVVAKKDDYASLLVAGWIVLAAIMAFTKLKFTYYFGLPIAAAAGVVVFELFGLVGERHGFEKKTVAFCLGFLFITGIAAGTYFVPQNMPQIEDQGTGWKEAVYWINGNIPEDARLFNWWDEGHWITFIGERSVSTDNRNMFLGANRDMGLFILAKSEDDAFKILHDYNADYVVLSEDLAGKMGSLSLYAYGADDPRKNEYLSGQIPCNSVTDSVTKEVSVRCGQNTIPKAQFDALPFRKIAEPNQLISSTSKAFVYRNEAGTSLFILNRAGNDTFIVTLLFDTENVKRFELVYSNKQVRIFKVNYQ